MSRELLPLPARVRVELGKSVGESRVSDAETGEEMHGIIGIKVDISGHRNNENPLVHIILAASGFIIEGHARYHLDEADMRMVANHHGFDLVKRAAK